MVGASETERMAELTREKKEVQSQMALIVEMEGKLEVLALEKSELERSLGEVVTLKAEVEQARSEIERNNEKLQNEVSLN